MRSEETGSFSMADFSGYLVLIAVAFGARIIRCSVLLMVSDSTDLEEPAALFKNQCVGIFNQH